MRRTLQSWVGRVRSCKLPEGKARFEVEMVIAEAVLDTAGASDAGPPLDLGPDVTRGETRDVAVTQTGGAPTTDRACVQDRLEGLAMAIPARGPSPRVRFAMTTER